MESSLHRQLKGLYGGSSQDCEVLVDGFRIDAVARGRLIEIQRASLSAIRDKIATLLKGYRVTLVKPIPARTRIVRKESADSETLSQRFSPLRRTVFHLFEELVHFVGVFPHPQLILEVILIEQEEWRIARTRRRRFNCPDYCVQDRSLLEIVSRHTFKTARDLAGLLPATLPVSFQSLDLAREANIPRWLAQKMIYCLRKTDVIQPVGKVGQAVLYRRAIATRSRKSA